MLCSNLKDMGKTVWLDVHMTKCVGPAATITLTKGSLEAVTICKRYVHTYTRRDMAAMEEGAKNCKCFLAIVTDNGQDSYFSRPMCRDEIKWAQVTPPSPDSSPKPRPEVWEP